MSTKNKKLENLLEAFLLLSDKKQMLLFFQDIFTPQEIESLSERWEIVQQLLGTDLPQREIAKKIGCSVALVSRASRQIKYGTNGFKNVYNVLKKSV